MNVLRISRRVVLLALALSLAPAAWADAIDDENSLKLKRVPERPAPPTGTVILDGALIAPPYAIAVIDGQLAINGREIEERAAAAPDPAVSPETLAKHRALETLFRSFRSWRAKETQAASLEKAVALMQSQPLVASVAVDSASNLRIKFLGESAEHRIELTPPDPDAISRDEARQRFLEDRAQAIEYALSRGSVVVLGPGVMLITPRAESSALLDKLRVIAESTDDVAIRAAALREIVPDDTLARAIAERYVPASGSEGGRP